MPNILLTSYCNQKCPYCFAINNIQDNKKVNAELSLKNLKIILDFLKRSREDKVRLMGGEPTLHSEFKKIVDYILSRGFLIHIFTNGIFSSNIANFLAGKKEDIKYSFNINPPEMYSKKTWNRIVKNLEILTPFKNSLIGSVIWQKDFDIDYLLDLAGKYPLKVIMLRIANPIVGENNKHVSSVQYSVLAQNFIREIKKVDKSKIKIGLGCGFSKKMFSKEQLKVLEEHEVVNLKWGCNGNSGCFDISADSFVFRCFPLSNWQRKRLTDFNKSKEVENYFAESMHQYQIQYSDHDYIHNGPCFAYLLRRNKINHGFQQNKNTGSH